MFAYRVLLALVFGVIAVVVVAAAYVGVLGPTIQSWLQTQAAPIVGLYRAHRDAVQLVILVVGTGVPAVTGSLAIFRGFYYAEQNLPARLQELIETVQIRHLSERPELLAYVRQPFNTNDFLVPGIMANPLSRLLSVIGISTTRYRARELASSITIRASELDALAAKKREIEGRKITGHLLRAAYFSRLAQDCEPKTPDWRAHTNAALDEYNAVLALRQDELDGLEGTIRQLEFLDSDPQRLMGRLLDAVEAAQRQKRPLQEARARRTIAAILDKLGTTGGWTEARAHLVAARDLLEPPAAFSSPEGEELARTLLLIGWNVLQNPLDLNRGARC